MTPILSNTLFRKFNGLYYAYNRVLIVYISIDLRFSRNYFFKGKQKKNSVKHIESTYYIITERVRERALTIIYSSQKGT